jgi:hypothetical protein
MPWAVIFCLCVVFTAEMAARLMVRAGRLEQDKSLQKLLEDNVSTLQLNRPPLWLVGNSVLEFGIDQTQMSKALGIQIIKLCHGGATVRGSAAMLDFYLNEISYKPEYVMLVVSKDDFNPNGFGAQTSETYLDLMTWKKFKRNYSWLRSVRGSLYDKILTLWSRVFVKKEDLHAWRERYQIVKINVDPQEVTRAMMKDYTIDMEALTFYAEICRRHELKNTGIALLPITEEYANWHNREFPDLTYLTIRNRLREMCRILGITLIDLGTPLEQRNLFRDLFHLNPEGAQYVTGLLSKKLLPLIHAQR